MGIECRRLAICLVCMELAVAACAQTPRFHNEDAAASRAGALVASEDGMLWYRTRE